MISDTTILDSRIDRRLAVDLDAAEGDRLEAYRDTEGNWTCGRGHLMPPAAPGQTWAGFTVPQSTSDRWFNADILNAMVLAQKWPEYAKCDTDCRRNALTEIAFNLGGKWEGFHQARAAIQAQDWIRARDNMLDSLWAKQVKGRAQRLANYILTGEYPHVVSNQ